ncbi:MAG: hypothetical protein IPN14_14405 [Bacteroidetes bacterium]|nr:hypothetical protein [Bacteroidota bacterium]
MNLITCTLAVTDPLGVNYYYGNVNPAITLSPLVASGSVAVLIPGVNMYARWYLLFKYNPFLLVMQVA